MKTMKRSSGYAMKGGAAESLKLSKRIVNSALSLVLVVGMMPSLAWADAADATTLPDVAPTVAAPADEAIDDVAVEKAATGADVLAASEIGNAMRAASLLTPLGDTPVYTIGTGAITTTYAPWYAYYYNTAAAMLYTADEIGSGAGTISSIGFHFYAGSKDLTIKNMRIYIGTVAGCAFGSGAVTYPQDLTLVYEDTAGTNKLNSGASDWQDFTLTTPYAYDGTSNLEIVVITDMSDETSGTPKVFATSTSNVGNTVVYAKTDTQGTYATATAGGTLSGTASTSRPDIRFAIAPGDDPAPTITPETLGNLRAGETASATCDATKTFSGDPIDTTKVTDLTYQWSYAVDGGTPVAIEGATGATVDFVVPSDITAGSTVTLSCAVSYKLDGEAKSKDVTGPSFTVVTDTEAATPAPTIDPAEISAERYTEARTLTASSGLTAGTEGVGTITYQWYKGDSADGEFAVIEGATAATYDASPEATVGDKYYKVIVTNTFEGIKVATGEAVAKFTTRAGSVNVATIGTGTSSFNTVPFENYYNNGLSEMLYTADEIKAAGGSAGLIKLLAFQIGTPASLATKSVKIYLGTTTDTALTSQVDPANLTLVMSKDAPTIGGTSGWETWTLDEPFMWDGESNLVVAVGRTGSAYSSTLKYCYTTTTNKTVWYRQNDSTAAYADATDTSYTGTSITGRPNVQLTIADTADPSPVISATSVLPQHAGDVVDASVDATKTATGKDLDTTRVTDLAYQWYYSVNGGKAIAIEGATSATVAFTIPAAIVAGSTVDLFCTVGYKLDGEAKTADSKNCEFTVITNTLAATPNPSITPKATSVMQGGTPATLTANSGIADDAAGLGTLTYQWYACDTVDGEYTEIAGATGATYDATAASDLGNTYYKVKVTNTFESVKVAEATSEAATVETKALEISTADQWITFVNAVNTGTTFSGKTVQLTADIDFEGATVPVCGTTYSNNFKGTLDGQGHVLRNMTIADATGMGGIFGQARGSSFKNFKVVGLSVTESYASSSETYAGGLIGDAYGVTVENVGVEGSITSSSSKVDMGGVIGKMDTTANTMKSCYFNGTISATNTGTSAHYVGGLVGYMSQYSTANCVYDSYATGTIVNDGTSQNTTGIVDCTGGVVGCIYNSSYGTAAYGAIYNCAFYGTMTNTGTPESVKPAGTVYVAAKEATLPMSAAKPCYFIDTCGAEAGVVPTTSTTTITGTYAVAKTADQLKAKGEGSVLASMNANAQSGDGFVMGAAGWPVPAWAQTDDPVPTVDPVTFGAVFAGQTLTAKVDASKNAQGETTSATIDGYQWCVSINGADAVAVEGATTADLSYTIPSTAAAKDSYDFTCVVSYTLDGVAKTVTSDVVNAGVVSATPAKTVVSATVAPYESTVNQGGDSATLNAYYTLSDEGGSDAVTYQWFTCDSDGLNAKAIKGATESSYAAAPQDEIGDYYYFCTVTNTFENVKVASKDSNVVKVETKGVEIGTPAELVAFAESVNAGTTYAGKTVCLTADIDMTGVDYTPAGTYSSASFQGTFDGAGHVISNLTINSSNASVGLFGYTKGATIGNVVLKDASVTCTCTSSNKVAMLVGYDDSSNIHDVAVQGTVIGASYAIGGLVGNISGSIKIERCAVEGTIGTAASSSSQCLVGGFWGYGSSAQTVTDSYVAATLHNDSTGYSSYTGGLFGGYYSTSTTFKNCFAMGSVTSAQTSNGAWAIAGYGSNFSSSFSASAPCYYLNTMGDGPLYGSATNDNVIAKTADEFASGDLVSAMNAATTDGTWVMDASKGHPVLSFQAPVEPLVAITPTDLGWQLIGSTVNLTADASKMGTGEDFPGTIDGYQWSYSVDGGTPIDIEGATSANLTFTVPNNAGSTVKVYCTVTYSGAASGTVTSISPAKMTVISATQPAQPSNVVVLPSTVAIQQGGEGVTLAVAYDIADEGKGILSYQWYVADDESGEGRAAIEGATAQTYAVSSDGELGTKYYFCDVTNTFETVKTASTLSTAGAVRTKGLEISTAEELIAFANAVNAGNTYAGKGVTLTADIDMTGVEGLDIIGKYTGTSTFTHFDGEFNGNGHKITGLSITSDNKTVGLFGAVGNANIHDLVVEGTIISTYSGGYNYVGGIAAYVSSHSTFTNCGFEGTVQGLGGYIGGIVGEVSTPAADFTGCYAKGTIGMAADTTTTDLTYIGGLVGYPMSMYGGSVHTTFTDCYTDCAVTNNYAGTVTYPAACGLFGGYFSTSSYPIVKNCLAMGSTSASNGEKAALFKVTSEELTNLILDDDAPSYYLSGMADSACGSGVPAAAAIAKSAAELASADMVTLLNSKTTEGTWKAGTDGHPVLSWEAIGVEPLTGLKGDINNNGRVNIVDAQIVLDLANGVYDAGNPLATILACWADQSATLAQVKAFADVNEDGFLDAADARATQRYAMG